MAEGFRGEAKTWHGLARALRRGLANMRIQAFLTAAAVNLKRLAASLGRVLLRLLGLRDSSARETSPLVRSAGPLALMANVGR